MGDKPSKPDSKDENEVQKGILRDRKFSVSEAIGRAAGAGVMKGASPVPKQRQAKAEIEHFLRIHSGSTDCLSAVLLRHVTTSEALLEDCDRPLVVLASCLQRILDSEHVLRELVREADVEWGRIQGERPHFEKDGPPHPDDPYTVESVRAVLARLLHALRRTT